MFSQVYIRGDLDELDGAHIVFQRKPEAKSGNAHLVTPKHARYVWINTRLPLLDCFFRAIPGAHRGIKRKPHVLGVRFANVGIRGAILDISPDLSEQVWPRHIGRTYTQRPQCPETEIPETKRIGFLGSRVSLKGHSKANWACHALPTAQSENMGV